MQAVAENPVIYGLVVALPEELATITRTKLQQGQQLQLNQQMWVIYAGVGFDNAQTAARNLLDVGVNHLVSWGCAAALDPNLQAGDLVMADQVIDGDQPWPSVPLNAIQQATGGLAVCRGGLLHSATLVDNGQHKQQLRIASGAIALDMESAAIARVADQATVPVTIIRAIADTADFDLPLAVTTSLNAQGQVELPRLLMHLLRHPGQLPQLIKLGRCFSAAQRSLRTAFALIQAH